MCFEFLYFPDFSSMNKNQSLGLACTLPLPAMGQVGAMLSSGQSPHGRQWHSATICVPATQHPAIGLDHSLQWANLFLSWAYLWSAWRAMEIPSDTAEPLYRWANCRNSSLLHQEACLRAVSLDRVSGWNLRNIFQEFWPGQGKPQCAFCPLLQYYGVEGLLLLVWKFILFPIIPSFILKARISSGVYWYRLVFFFLHHFYTQFLEVITVLGVLN